LKDVIHLRVEDDMVWCARFFEDPAAVKGTISEIDFLKHQVHITPANSSER
jgi:predicted RNA-binding protein